MTINETRQKLYGILKHLFTDAFAQKYEMISAQSNLDTADGIMRTYANDVEALILLVGEFSDKPDVLSRLARIANPLVVFAFFYRYHLMTQFLVASPQDEVRDFPTDDKGFFKAIMIDLFNEMVERGRSM